MFSKLSSYLSKMKLKFATVILIWIGVVNSAPLARHMVDMTYTFDETTLHYPGTKEFKMDVTNVTLENGLWLQFEEYSSEIHVGTHMDAPAHFSLGGLTIDQIPVDHFIAPAAVVDITQQAAEDRDYIATVEDLLGWESATGQTLNGTVLLLRSGWGKKWHNQEDFFGTAENDGTKLHFPGLCPEAAQWLVDNRQIVGFGSETLSLDNGPSQTFDVHRIVLPHGIYGLENVANMDKLPIYGATLYVMPVNIKGASGAPTRIIATYPHVMIDYQSLCSSKD